MIAPAKASPGIVNNLPVRTGDKRLRTKPAATERTPAVALAHQPLASAHHLNRDVADFTFAPGEQVKTLRHHLEHHLGAELRNGGRVLAIAGAIVLGWAGLVPLSGAVIVNGSLVVHSEVKKVQHPSGGVVAAIAVRNGSKVEAGQELVRLDGTSARVVCLRPGSLTRSG